MEILNKTIENPYLTEFNKNFGFNYEIRKSTDIDEEIKDNPPVDIGYFFGKEADVAGNFNTVFSIIPFEDNGIIPDISNNTKEERESVLKYQLIQYHYHPARGMNPPETEDVVIGNYFSFQQALNKAMEISLMEKFNGLLEFVYETELGKDENERLDQEFEG